MNDPLWIGAGKNGLVGTATIAAATDLFTITAHGLVDGETVTVDTLTGGAIGVLVEDAVYFVRDAALDTFALSLTQGGPQVLFAADGGAEVHRFAPQYNARELRRAMAMLLTGGGATAFGAREGVHPSDGTSGDVVTISGTTVTVVDHKAVVYPGLTSQSGPYVVQTPQVDHVLNPPDGTNPRIDAIDLQIQDHDEDASGFRRAHTVLVTGTPAATPSAPAVTATSLRLATITVPQSGGGAATVTNINPFTVAAGGTIPVRSAGSLPGSAGRYPGMPVWRRDISAAVWWDGSDWATGWPASVTGTNDAIISGISSTGYTAAGGGNAAAVFTAPITGRVMITFTVLLEDTAGTNNTLCAPEVRTGGTIGSGTVVYAAADVDAVRNSQSLRKRHTGHVLVEGLVGGNVYNARLLHRVAAGATGQVDDRRITVVPVP